MGIWEKLGSLEPKIVYLILLLSTVIPIIYPFNVPIPITDTTQEFYDYIENAPAGSHVYVRAYSPLDKNMDAYPNHMNIYEHLLRKDFKLLIGGPDSWPTGNDAMLRQLGAFEREEYGVDFVIIGNIPGLEPAYLGFCEDIHYMIKSDMYGTPIEELPLMKEFRSVDDFDFIISMAGGGTAMVVVRNVFSQKYGKTVLLTSSISNIGPAIDWHKVGLLKAIVYGQKGAAEYEVLLDKPGLAIAGIASVTVSCFAIIGLLILGNTSLFMQRYFKKRV